MNFWEAVAFSNAASTADGLPECYALTGCDAALPGEGMVCTDVTVTSATGNPLDCTGWRLPTEAEWERAARGGEDHAYAGSDVLDDVGWYGSDYGGNSGPSTQPVCGLQPNGYDLCDMSGNVNEWLWDRDNLSYLTETDPRVDPVGPSSGTYRARRGGSWHYVATTARVAYRHGVNPDNGYHHYGARLVRTAP